MEIEAVDFFYLSMPVVTDDADGSQDALVVKVSAGDFTGWGECEASPLVSIAAFVTPMSHGACQPVKSSVLGQQIEDLSDIDRIARLVARNSMDLLQAQHTWSGIEIALWDLLGKKRGIAANPIGGDAGPSPIQQSRQQLYRLACAKRSRNPKNQSHPK